VVGKSKLEDGGTHDVLYDDDRVKGLDAISENLIGENKEQSKFLSGSDSVSY